MSTFATRYVLGVLGLATLGTQSALADDCKFSATRTATIDGGPIRKVVIAAGAGALVVVGTKSRTKAEAMGKACASSQELLDQIQIETRTEGVTLYIKTLLPEGKFQLIDGGSSPTLDLTVSLPDAVQTNIDDSSGSLELRGVGASVVADSSGEIEIANIQGDVSVTDSSGHIHIDAVTGNLQIQDTSGGIDVHDVSGTVEIPSDSSGGILLRKISGSAHIVSDSSGDIVIEQVQHDVIIDADSSGDIRVAEVAGNFTVGADSSGGIHHDRVLGKVQLPPGRD